MHHRAADEAFRRLADRQQRQPCFGAGAAEEAQRVFGPVDAGLGENRRMQGRQTIL